MLEFLSILALLVYIIPKIIVPLLIVFLVLAITISTWNYERKERSHHEPD